MLRAACVLSLLAAPAVAEDACYTLAPGSMPYRVQSMTVDAAGTISVTVPGAPFVAFEMDCPFGPDGSAQCSVDCDGGNVSLTPGPEVLIADFAHLRFEQATAESLVFGQAQFDADGYALSGRFVLQPAPASACGPAAAAPFDFAPGDFHPAVLRIESYLVQGGYLTEVPDWSYTDATAEAVAAFQAEQGLDPTGRTDPALLARLGVFTRYAFGGC